MNRSRYPFSAVVGQAQMKTALLVVSVDPSIGGVLIRGEKGTAKSTIVRAFRDLLPTLEVVSGCPYHCHPSATAGLCAQCRGDQAQSQVQSSPRPRGNPETREIPVPLVELPLGATEDRLVGTLDVEAALSSGTRRFEPGLLAEANRGILYVDEVNLLEDHLVDLLLDASAGGENVVEREGISLRHPSRFILFGTMNPEEGELRPQFLDRFGLCVTVRGLADPDERVEVIRRRAAFESDAGVFAGQWKQEDLRLRSLVLDARARVADVVPSDSMLHLAVRIGAGAGVAGHRADIALIKTARAFAALLGRREVEADLIYEAARFVLPHRFEGRLLRSPEEAAAEIESLIGRLRDGESGTGPEHSLTPSEEPSRDEEFSDEVLESMQIPGGAAAGSILLPILKKKSLETTIPLKSAVR